MKPSNLKAIKSASLFFHWMIGALVLALTVGEAGAFDNSDLNLRNTFLP